MRRGSRLLLLLGVLIAALAALVLYVVLVSGPGGAGPGQAQLTTPTTEPKQNVVTALIDIQSDTVLSDTATYLTTEAIPEAQYNENPKKYFLSPAELQRKITLTTITAGSPILQSDVTDTGLSLQIPAAQEGQPRPKAVAFQVNNLTGVADQIRPNDFVDVLASFTIDQLTFRPGYDDNGTPTIKEETFPSYSTKTLVQNVQVLKIVKPPVAPEGTPTPGGKAEAPPQTDASGQPIQPGQEGAQGTAPSGDTIVPGTWTLVLAVTDQQAEIIKYSIERGNGMTLVLRGRGDTAVETTLGATLDLLISQFGLPVPNPIIPNVIQGDRIAPLPNNAVPQPVPPAVPVATPAP